MKNFFVSPVDSKIKNAVELTEDSRAVIDGREYDYQCKFINENVLVLRINHKNYFLTVVPAESENLFEVNLDSKNYKLFCKSDLEELTDMMSNNKAADKIKNEILSPMPGIIKALNVKEGQKVNKGDVLLVLEAMKMENEIKAANDCVIKKINAEQLSSVEKNELLIVIE